MQEFLECNTKARQMQEGNEITEESHRQFIPRLNH